MKKDSVNFIVGLLAIVAVAIYSWLAVCAFYYLSTVAAGTVFTWDIPSCIWFVLSFLVIAINVIFKKKGDK